MYCSSCGGAVAQALSYCNHCGAKLNRGDTVVKSSEGTPETLIAAIVALFIFGLLAITILMGVMKAVLDLDAGQIMGFASISFLMLFLIEGILIRLLLRRTRETGKAGDTVLLREQATKELDPAQARALPEPIPSVTEHTTRAFDTIYSERTSK